MANKITPAKLRWRQDIQGNLIPVSTLFNDVYYSLADGLNESRYVFIKQNNLPERFKALLQHQYIKDNIDTLLQSTNFTILELGFGTGLNVLATWQLWQQVKRQISVLNINDNSAESPHNSSPSNAELNKLHVPHLHIISTEKYPLTLTDLKRSLNSWQKQDASLRPLVDNLLAVYPTLIAGCHRLHLQDDVTLDLWFGDAATSLNKLHATNEAAVDAWYLDGFAPSCNDSLWAMQIFEQMKRLSTHGTTAATFSCAGVVKRGLVNAGFAIEKVKGFGHKRHMLRAIVSDDKDNKDDSTQPRMVKSNQQRSQPNSDTLTKSKYKTDYRHPYQHVAIVGAGVSGLTAAWALARRGIQVTLLDKTAPLAGASGNPRALLAPKMTPILHVAEHLHSMGYLYSQRFYRQLDNGTVDANGSSAKSAIFEPTATLDLLLKANIDTSQIAEYPDAMATVLSPKEAQALTTLTQQPLDANLYLPQAGLINPVMLVEKVLSHPNISFQQATVTNIKTKIETEQEDISPYSLAASNKQMPTVPSDLVELILQTKSTMSKNHAADALSSIQADAVIIATAYESQSLDSRIFEFRKIRGQLSWFQPTTQQLKALPKLPLKYGGYCAGFIPHYKDTALNPVTADTPTFLLGASFVRNDTSTAMRQSEHGVNFDKLIKAVPELSAVSSNNKDKSPANEENANANIKEDFSDWQGRVGIRAQTPDYHPVVGMVDENGLVWTLSGMGSKGYAFAPLCAEALADSMTGRFAPLSNSMMRKVSPKRHILQQLLK